ncbi:MAG: NrsF family protein [Sphingomicrobium sp.]
MTDDLIVRLAGDVVPVPHRAIARRLATGIIAGVLVSGSYLVMMMGVRPDIDLAMRGCAFWMKWGYTLSLSIVAAVMTARLARPDSGSLRWLWLTAIPVLLLAGAGVLELVRTSPDAWLAMWLGESWTVCTWRVLVLATPIYIGLLWSFRRLAPTRLRAAGATAGLTAGAFAAMVYCVHCPEVSAIFVLTWYSLGILLATASGAILGPRLLRW